MFTLTYEQVAEKAREYYKAGKLTAQHRDKKERQCVNNGADGHKCAVAASYPDDFKVEESFLNHLRKGEIHVEDRIDAIRIQRIQDAHDTWAGLSRTTEDKAALSQLEYIFQQSVGIPMPISLAL